MRLRSRPRRLRGVRCKMGEVALLRGDTNRILYERLAEISDEDHTWGSEGVFFLRAAAQCVPNVSPGNLTFLCYRPLVGKPNPERKKLQARNALHGVLGATRDSLMCPQFFHSSMLSLSSSETLNLDEASAENHGFQGLFTSWRTRRDPLEATSFS